MSGNHVPTHNYKRSKSEHLKPPRKSRANHLGRNSRNSNSQNNPRISVNLGNQRFPLPDNKVIQARIFSQIFRFLF